MTHAISVLLVDDYAVIRQGLRALISTAPDIVVVGEAGDGATAVSQSHMLCPDVAIMDMVMPGLDSLEAIRLIRQQSPHTRILVLTNFGDEKRVLAALAAGVHGYLLKDAVLTDIIEAIHQVYNGKPALHPSISHVLVQAVQRAKT